MKQYEKLSLAYFSFKKYRLVNMNGYTEQFKMEEVQFGSIIQLDLKEIIFFFFKLSFLKHVLGV